MRAFIASRIEGRAGPLGPRRGSVLVIVMITLVFATFALIAFMEKASVDLMVDQREVLARRLRMEAYSSLEVTLAVLSEFNEVNGGLRSPAEGWSNPLEFAGYAPAEDRRVEIAFEDESGKISLPRANPTILKSLFKHWELTESDAETLADALLGWIKKDHVYSTALNPDYELNTLPYEAPARSLRSYQELAAIEKVREMFYDSEGRPNHLWQRFVDSVSLFDFPRPNLNGAKPDTLAALGQLDSVQQADVGDYLAGRGMYQDRGPGFFENTNDAQRIVGPSGDMGQFGTSISALRIRVTVWDGRTEFRLATVVAPPNGATTVQTTATSQRTQTSQTRQQQNQANEQQSQPQTQSSSSGPSLTRRNLKYPFTLLDIRENNEIPALPPPPPGEQPI